MMPSAERPSLRHANVAYLRHPKLGHGAKLAYMALAAHSMRAEGSTARIVYDAPDTICRATGCSVRSAQTWLKELVTAGVLAPVGRGPKINRLGPASIAYEIVNQ